MTAIGKIFAIINLLFSLVASPAWHRPGLYPRHELGHCPEEVGRTPTAARRRQPAYSVTRRRT